MSLFKLYRKEWQCWYNAKYRCEHPDKYPHYQNIRFDPTWTFEQFMKDMGPCPDDCVSVDRIDPLGDYTASNCRWANHSTQRRNQRHNQNREEYWYWYDQAQLRGITGSLFRSRIGRMGYTPQQAALSPNLGRGRLGRRRKTPGF